MHIRDIRKFLPDVLIEVGEIMNKDVSEINVDIAHKELTFQSVQHKRFEEFSKLTDDLMKQLNQKNSKPFSLLNLFFDWFNKELYKNSAYMFCLDGSKIFLTSLGLNGNEEFIQSGLAHELVHIVDEHYYHHFEENERFHMEYHFTYQDYLKEHIENRNSYPSLKEDFLMKKVWELEGRLISLRNVVESHAAYIQNIYCEENCINLEKNKIPFWIKVLDFVGSKISPLQVSQEDMKAMSPYFVAQDLIDSIYREDLDLSFLYKFLPRPEALQFPQAYIDIMKEKVYNPYLMYSPDLFNELSFFENSQ